MDITSTTERRIGRSAWAMAWVALVVGQLHALSRFATADGAEDLELAGVAAWAVPAADWLAPLLEWADPDTVYLTYGKVWIPVFVAFTAAAYVLMRHRRPVGFERVTWWVSLTGYSLATLSVVVFYGTQWTGYVGWAEQAYEVTILPGFLLTMVGSTVLGVALLRNRVRPKATGWLLALTIPIAFVVLLVTSLGSAVLPVIFAFGLSGRSLAGRVSGSSSRASEALAAG